MLIKVQFLPVLLYTKNGDFVHFPIIAMLGYLLLCRLVTLYIECYVYILVLVASSSSVLAIAGLS